MKQKILIVDDESDFCAILESYFSKRGYDVSVVHTVEDGMKAVKELRPEILFLDNNMPDGNGWDAINEIVEIVPHVKAFLVSAYRKNSPLINMKSNVVIWEKPLSLAALNSIISPAD